MPVCDVWVGTEPRRDAGKPGQLRQRAGLGASQQSPFVRLHSGFRQHCECPGASMPFTCSCCGTGELKVLVLPALPLHPEEKTMALLETTHVCLDTGHLCPCIVLQYVRTSQDWGSEALWSPTAMSKKCKYTLLDILASPADDSHTWASARRMDTPHTLHSHMFSLNLHLHHQNFRRLPRRTRTGSLELFLISAGKQNSSTPQGKAASEFLLRMAHFQNEITIQIRDKNSLH